MKKSYLLLVFLIMLNFLSVAQINLVPNSSFENFTSCPNFSGQINFVNDWNNVNLVYGNFSYGTPDYYNTCSSSSLATLPNNSFGSLNAFDGNGLMGLVLFNFDITDYREYMSTQLNQPLNIESTYTIKFRITGGTNQNYRFNSDNFGIVFSESPLSQTTWSLINDVPQIEINTLLNTPQWNEYSFTYTPDKSYSYITLGSFRHDSDINFINTTTSVNKYSYVFVDAIEVLSNQTGIERFASNSKITLRYFDEELTIINPENETIQFVQVSDLFGRVIFSSNSNLININTIDLPNGLNSGMYIVTIKTPKHNLTHKFGIIK